jgi:hypothetical protein
MRQSADGWLMSSKWISCQHRKIFWGFPTAGICPPLRMQIEMEKELTIRLVTPPYFLATKIEAFKGRGGGDYMASHDIEDIITVMDGRPEIVSEIRNSSDDLKIFLSGTFRMLLAKDEFLDAIPGHLPPDRASQARLSRLIRCLGEILKMSC